MNENTNEIIGHTWFKWGVIVSVLMLATFLTVKTASLLQEYRFIGGGVPVTNVVTVSGEGEVFAVPDIATFSFSVTEEGSTVEDAQEVATEKINSMIKFLKDGGVKEEDIKTTSYNVYPRYEYRRVNQPGIEIYPPDRNRELVGFEVTQSISVKVRDTKEAGGLLSGIGSRGVTNVSGLQFTIDDEDELKTEARKKAIDDARDKAKQLAGDLDVKLVRVVSFNEFGASPYGRYSLAEGIGGSADSFYEVKSPEIPLGENKIVSNVSITYEIR